MYIIVSISENTCDGFNMTALHLEAPTQGSAFITMNDIAGERYHR